MTTRRWTTGILIILTVLAALAAALPVYAQDSTPPLYTPEELDAVVRRAEGAAARIEDALISIHETEERANQAIDLASNMFGLFEAMSGAVGLVVPFLAIAAGLLGFRRLENAASELREARDRFARDIEARSLELDQLRDELRQVAAEQRERSGKASLAMSLLPVGERQYRAQDFTGALDTYRRALLLDPENPVVHYRLGYVYTQSGELDMAKKHLEHSLHLDNEFAPSRAALGYVYRRQGDKMPPSLERDKVYNEAERNFLQALDLSPKLVDDDGESWWGSLGGLYRRRGQVEQAIHAYERCAEVTPQSSYPFSNLALLYAVTHNQKHMIETYRRVEQLARSEVQAEVDNYWAHADLITARLALGKVAEAEEVLETALRIVPEDSPYMLDSLVETLNRLLGALDSAQHPPVLRVIDRIKNHQAGR